MGWLGWTYDQTLDTPMPAIEAAHAGRIKMLRAIFGTTETEAREQSEQPARRMTPKLFDALFSGTKGG